MASARTVLVFGRRSTPPCSNNVYRHSGYTALGQRSESLSFALMEEQRKVIRPVLARLSGREVKTMGDAFLVEFQNAIGAVRCA